jgi:hypothetical protein
LQEAARTSTVPLTKEDMSVFLAIMPSLKKIVIDNDLYRWEMNWNPGG